MIPNVETRIRPPNELLIVRFGLTVFVVGRASTAASQNGVYCGVCLAAGAGRPPAKINVSGENMPLFFGGRKRSWRCTEDYEDSVRLGSPVVRELSGQRAFNVPRKAPSSETALVSI
jgi:hypothetical protein